jgi:hypothetical protein
LTFGDCASALAAAVSLKRCENIKILIQAGADVDLPLLHGRYGDVISLAIHNNDYPSLHLLQSAGVTLGPLALAKLYEHGSEEARALFNLQQSALG